MYYGICLQIMLDFSDIVDFFQFSQYNVTSL